VTLTKWSKGDNLKVGRTKGKKNHPKELTVKKQYELVTL